MILYAILLGLLLLAAGAVLAWRYARRADGDFLDLPARLLVTGIILAPLLWVFIQGGRTPGNPGLGFVGLALVLVCGVPLAILWVPALTQAVLSPLFGAWTGGTEEVEPRPFYSRAIAHRKHGRYPEALAEIEAQLARFPGDLAGLMMRAEIEADNLGDLTAALATLHEILATPGRDRGERNQVLFRLAEWQQHRVGDVGAAREVLERLRDENPGSETAQRAAQHLAHLPGVGAAPGGRRAPLVVRRHEASLGLSDDLGAAQAEAARAGTDPGEELHSLNAHLAAHPGDWEARERLVQLYAGHLRRPDLAHEELERMIRAPGQPAREVVRWLNRVADLHLESPDLAAARLTLDRISEHFPGTAAAEQAERRKAQLGIVLQGRRETPTLKLGSYEANPGLKWGRPGDTPGAAEEPSP